MTKKERKDVYQIVTEKVLDALKKGLVPWRKTWRGVGGQAAAMPANYTSKKPYRGINIFLLQIAQEVLGSFSPYWVSFKQAQELNAPVRKGEHGTLVVFWKWIDPKPKAGEEPEEAQGDKKKVSPKGIPFLRYYLVWNLSQLDLSAENCKIKKEQVEAPKPSKEESKKFKPLKACEALLKKAPKPPIKHGGDRAFYVPAEDRIQMPNKEDFEVPAHYYATLWHELTHSTGHTSRLSREEVMGLNFFGDHNYSKEELVAEMGAAFLCTLCGIDGVVLENQEAYIKHWVSKLESNPKWVVCAAGKAQKAADFLTNTTFKE